jgi:hypothetical protein
MTEASAFAPLMTAASGVPCMSLLIHSEPDKLRPARGPTGL